MKIETKTKNLTWRMMRERYELLSMITGLKGINLLSAYSHNLSILKDLYEQSAFLKQYPESEGFKAYQKERIDMFTELATVDGIVQKKIVEINGNSQEILDFDANSPESRAILMSLNEKYSAELATRIEEERLWIEDLDSEVDLGGIPIFWKAPHSEAPDEQAAYLAVEWFLKELPDLT